MRTSTTVNAGSMADIAFLMLIFFLTTTTIMNDAGLDQTLPKPCETEDCSTDIAKQNLLTIAINHEGAIMLQQEEVVVNAIAEEVIRFVDNASNSIEGATSPDKAVIQFTCSRDVPYSDYVKVLDQIKSGYATMREDYSKLKFDKPFNELNGIERKLVLKQYPLQLAEASGLNR